MPHTTDHLSMRPFYAFFHYWMAQALTNEGFSGPKGRVVCADALNRPEHWRE